MTTPISDSIRTAIAVGERSGARLTEIRISDAAARELARELYAMQAKAEPARFALYRRLKSGASQFMGLTVIVAAD